MLQSENIPAGEHGAAVSSRLIEAKKSIGVKPEDIRADLAPFVPSWHACGMVARIEGMGMGGLVLRHDPAPVYLARCQLLDEAGITDEGIREAHFLLWAAMDEWLLASLNEQVTEFNEKK